MKKLLFILSVFISGIISAQTPSTIYIVQNISGLQSYFGNANRLYVVSQNQDYVLCSPCLTDSIAGAGGRKWRKMTDSTIAVTIINGDTAILSPVIDTTGQPAFRVLYGVAGNHIGSSSLFLFDSVNHKLVINNSNAALGGTQTKLYVQGGAFVTADLKGQHLFQTASFLTTDTNTFKPIGRSTVNGGISNFATWGELIKPLARSSIVFTTTGTSGAATYNSATGALNIPNYTSTHNLSWNSGTHSVDITGGTSAEIPIMTSISAGLVDPGGLTGGINVAYNNDGTLTALHTIVNFDQTFSTSGTQTRFLNGIGINVGVSASGGQALVTIDADTTNGATHLATQGDITRAISGGSSTFVGLTDGPGAFTGKTLNFMRVNAGETALEYRTPSQVLSDIGATTIGGNIFTLTNPSALGYIRVNADNTVTHRSYANVKVDLSLDNVDNTSDATKNSATATLTNKTITPRAVAVTAAAQPTYNITNGDVFNITGQTTDITSMTANLSGNSSGSIPDWKVFQINITGTAARAIVWGLGFENSTISAPTTTVSTNMLSTLWQWNPTTTKLRCIGWW